MQYCSLQHRILLLSPDISTIEHCFHSGPATSFFLGLLVVVFWVVEKGCLLQPACFSWQNSVSLCPASFCTLRPNFPVTPGISWLPTFAFQSPMMNRTSLFLVLVLESLLGRHRTDQLQLLQHQWLGYRLGLLWCWMVYLEHELKSFCCFLRMNLSTAFWTLVLIVRATPFLLWDSCPQ